MPAKLWPQFFQRFLREDSLAPFCSHVAPSTVQVRAYENPAHVKERLAELKVTPTGAA